MPEQKLETGLTLGRVEEGSLLRIDDDRVFHFCFFQDRVWTVLPTSDAKGHTICDPVNRRFDGAGRVLRWIVHTDGSNRFPVKVNCHRCVEILTMPFPEIGRLCTPHEFNMVIELGKIEGKFWMMEETHTP